MSSAFIQSTASSEASCMSDIVPGNFRKGHSVTIWNVVCCWCPQSQLASSDIPHLCFIYWHLPWPVRIRLRVVHVLLGRLKPGGLCDGSIIKFAESGFEVYHSFCQAVWGRKSSRISLSPSFQEGLLDFSLCLWLSRQSWCNGKSGSAEHFPHSLF